MDVYTQVNISRGSQTEKELTNGLPDNFTKAIGKMEKGMGLVDGKQLMAVHTQANGGSVNLKVLEFMYQLTVELTKGNLKTH